MAESNVKGLRMRERRLRRNVMQHEHAPDIEQELPRTIQQETERSEEEQIKKKGIAFSWHVVPPYGLGTWQHQHASGA